MFIHPEKEIPAPFSDEWAEMERSLSSEGRFEELYEALLRSARLHPDSRQGAERAVRAARAALEGLGGDLERAREAARLATVIDPSSKTAWQLLLEIQAQGGDLFSAAESLVRLGRLESDPQARARYLLQAGDAFRQDPQSNEQPQGGPAALAYLEAVRSIPPKDAAGPAARRLLSQGGRIDALVNLLLPDEGCRQAAPAEEAERDLVLGRILAADPARRAEAVEHLLAAAEKGDGPGRVALEVLGGLYGLFEGWSEMASGLERDAGLLEENEPEQAATLLKRVVSACLEEPVALERAEHALRRLVVLDPGDIASVERLIEILGAGGRHREALNILLDLAEVADAPTAATHLMRAGVLELARFGERAACLRRFEDALARHPSCKAAATHLKEAYRDSGRWRDLARVMVAEVEGRRVDEKVLEVWREAGRILRDHAGDVVAAAEVYRRIVAHDSMDEDAVAFFEDFHGRIDREAEAVEMHSGEAAAAYSPADRVQSLVRAAEAAIRLGSPPRARKLLEEAREIVPEDRDLRERLLAMLLEHGDHRLAADLITGELNRLEVGDEEWQALAWRLALLLLGPLGEPATASSYLEKLAGMDSPRAPEATELLEDLKRDLSKASSALNLSFIRRGHKTAPRPDEEPSLSPARDAMNRGEMEKALEEAGAVAEAHPVSSKLGLEARELIADLLIDHLGDVEEGLDRLAGLGRDRSLPVGVRRRVNEARVRLLARDLPPSGQRDAALAHALLDAAAVADDREQALAYRYRAGRLFCNSRDAWRLGVEILDELLLDDPGSPAAIEVLAETFDRE
ncbi:MAG: hypothetical protein ACOC0J_02240, partial [Myxococcota bacterium]